MSRSSTGGLGRHVDQVSQWCYRGLWGVLAGWFRVPRDPPTLPIGHHERLLAFHPSEGFLRYLKLQFWIWLTLIDGLILVGWLALTVASPVWGLILALPALLVAIVPDIIAYLAIHLRYDTTWYVLSDRSLRIRRGIWIIHETTITFENIQNVSISQGPLQRWFGISNVEVETAGGGGGQPQHQQGNSLLNAHQGLIEGIDNAAEIREILQRRLRHSLHTGLGDEQEPAAPSGPRSAAIVARATPWSQAHLEVLREIRNELARASGS